ncbi:MAG TPA: cupin domain-containing protein [Terracidiphilus sp.]|nr:cupin domain-containing protein [Terracidiphilus sp.]
MAIVDIARLPEIERLPGWRGRFFHSEQMTVAHYEFRRGSSIHEHHHPQEEIYHVLEGELALTVDGVTQVARPGLAAIVPGNARHSAKALTDGRVVIVDAPRRDDVRGKSAGQQVSESADHS